MIPRYQVTLTISGSFHYTKCKVSSICPTCALPLHPVFMERDQDCCLFPHRQQKKPTDRVGSCRISQDFSEMVGFLNCRRLFRVTVLRKTVTCSADPRAKSQHRQISTHRIRQNVGFLPGDFQKSQHRTHMNRPAPCKPPLPTAKKTHIPET